MFDSDGASLWVVGTWAGLALVAEGCEGRVVPLGTNSVQLAEVSTTSVSPQPTQCLAGSAHPNVCCLGGADVSASCGTYPDDPFHACDPDRTTYPDPRSCCDLNTHECGPPPQVPPPPPAGQCVYGCPIGWYATHPITATSGACCSDPVSAPGGTGPTGGGCFGWGFTTPSPPLGGTTPTDAGASGFCDYTCPDGWQPLTPGQPDICCRSTGLDGGLELECFNQGTPPASGGNGTTSSSPGGPPGGGSGPTPAFDASADH